MFVPRRKLHAEGPEISELVYGVWKLADDPKGSYPGRVAEKIQTCLDIGITTFDHADIYGNYSCEELFGNALRQNKHFYKRIEIITKCGIMMGPGLDDQSISHYDTTKEHILFSVESSLEKLGTEKIDLLLLHRPDPLMNPEEIASAFYELKKEGKVIHFGVTNFSYSQILMLQSYLDVPLVTNQIEISPVQLNPFLNGVIDACFQLKIRPMAWTPYGGGYIFNSEEERANRIRQVIYELARERNATFEEILLAWLIEHPVGMIPIIGTNQVERIQIIKDYRKVQISRPDWFRIWAASTGEELP